MSNASNHLRAMILEERCVDLYAYGYSFRRIGEALGCSHTAAKKHVDHALQMIHERTADKAANQQAEELNKLNIQERKAMGVLGREHVVVNAGKVVKDDSGAKIIDDGPVLQAVHALIRIAERRAKLLGLDAPAKTELTGADGGPLQIQEARRQLLEELLEDADRITREASKG